MSRRAISAIVLLILCGGCGRGYGYGPASDGEQQELERLRRERDATGIKMREAEKLLPRLIGGGR